MQMHALKADDKKGYDKNKSLEERLEVASLCKIWPCNKSYSIRKLQKDLK
jgi:hypothetical protein